MRIFGIDPGSVRTGYGCVETDGSSHRLVICGIVAPPAGSSLPDRLQAIHAGLVRLLEEARPDCVVVDNAPHVTSVWRVPSVWTQP